MKKILEIYICSSIFMFASEFSAMQKACEKKMATACYELGLVYENGFSGDKNTTKAKLYYMDACQYGYDKACNALDKPVTNL